MLIPGGIPIPDIFSLIVAERITDSIGPFLLGVVPLGDLGWLADEGG